ncbi:MAG: FtsW/RodA/SpoVE family cell cycle protein [Planctomycetes bacterium]|nr:FtsW/RodA/SpoVE family cell cycle protein [Planctomycetota bacterium]
MMTTGATSDPAAKVHLRELDHLMLVTVALACLGLVMAVSVLGSRVGVGPLMAVQQHSWKLMFGLAAFLVAAAVPMRLLQRAALPLFVVTTVACLLPHLTRDVKGAHRWIHIGDYQFQPVEPARFFMILAVALLLGRAGNSVATFRRGFYPAMGCAALLAGVLLTQPDNGNALIVLGITSVLALIAGVRMLHFAPFALVGAALFSLVALQHDYVRSRIDQFLAPAPSSQVGLGLIAVGSGGVAGRGLGQGWMKMGFVPEAHNDFVFAIIGEEFGFLGSAFVLLSFTAFGWICWRLALKVRDPFLRYVVCGYALMICMQAAANLLVVSGWAPAKGIDLPFVSTGGTSLMFCFAAVGLIGNAARADRSGAFQHG